MLSALRGMAKRIGNWRVETSRDELIANGSWKPIPRTGVVQIDGQAVNVREMYDTTSGETWFNEVRGGRKSSVEMPTELLTTPEEDFGTGRRGGSGATSRALKNTETRFKATHTLNHDGRRIPVRKEEGHAGGHVLYTRGEWESASLADWEQQPGAAVTFQGRHTGATLTRHGNECKTPARKTRKR